MDHKTMMDMDADALATEIQRHNDLYWTQDAPEIPDTLYDAMVERLRALKPDAAELIQVGAGDIAPDEGTKITHKHPMLSLDKCYSEDELLKWFDRFDGGAYASHKIDGVALSVRYDDNGALELGVTRGNGRVGERITENVKRIGGIPLKVDVPNLEVRGEAFMPLTIFRSRYAEQFANPRNLTAGAIKQKDPQKTADYSLRFFAYDGIGLPEAASEQEKRDQLTALGFTPAPGAACERDNAQETFEQLAAHRERNDFETDGIVFKVADVTQHEALGLTAHHPRWAIAYKYQGESGISTFQRIEWNVSRSGAINPVAIVAPVSLSGVTVTRVSLHNLAIMEKLADTPLTPGDNPASSLSEGARVLVTRRGGVIPHIEAVVEGKTGNLAVPTACPECGQPSERRADFLFAEHLPECSSQGVRSIEHFVKVVDIQGFGPKILAQLWDLELVRSPAHLFTLRHEDLANLDRLGRRSAQNLVDQVEAHRNVPVSTFLAALGIPDLGNTVSRAIDDWFSEALAPLDPDAPAPQTELFTATDAPFGDRVFAAIRTAKATDFEEIPGIGPIVSERIENGLAANAPLIDALLEHITLTAEPPAPAPTFDDDHPVAGRSFVFTGTLTAMKRNEAQQRVRALGGETPSGVSSKLDYLVIGDEDFAKYEEGWRSSKLKKADAVQAKGDSPLKVIAESHFLTLIES